MIYSGMLFAFALYAAFSLSADVVATNAPDAEEEREVHSPRRDAGLDRDDAAAGVGRLPVLRDRLLGAGHGRRHRLVGRVHRGCRQLGRWPATRPRRACGVGSTSGRCSTARSGSAVRRAWRPAPSAAIAAIVALAFVLSLGGAVARLGFEAMVQRDAPARQPGPRPRQLRDEVPAVLGGSERGGGRRDAARSGRRPGHRHRVQRRARLPARAAAHREQPGGDIGRRCEAAPLDPRPAQSVRRLARRHLVTLRLEARSGHPRSRYREPR